MRYGAVRVSVPTHESSSVDLGELDGVYLWTANAHASSHVSRHSVPYGIPFRDFRVACRYHGCTGDSLAMSTGVLWPE